MFESPHCITALHWAVVSMALMVYNKRERGLCFDFEEVMEGVKGMLEACLEGCKEVAEFRRRVGERLEAGGEGARRGVEEEAWVEGGAEAIV